MNILELPDCVLEIIFGYLSYDDIAKYRIVSFVVEKCLRKNINKEENFKFIFF